MKHLFILLYFNFSLVYTQNKTELYIEYSPKMNIVNTIDENIRLSFNLISSDEEPSIYNFNIPNIGENFENLTFQEIRDTISDTDLTLVNIKTLNSFNNVDFCELQYLFADTKNIFLIKREKDINYIYKLIYWSTRRGWEFSKN